MITVSLLTFHNLATLQFKKYHLLTLFFGKFWIILSSTFLFLKNVQTWKILKGWLHKSKLIFSFSYLPFLGICHKIITDSIFSIIGVFITYCTLWLTSHNIHMTVSQKPSDSERICTPTELLSSNSLCSWLFFWFFFYNQLTVVKTQSWIELWNSILSCKFFLFCFWNTPERFLFYSPILFTLWCRYLQTWTQRRKLYYLSINFSSKLPTKL